jgi:hypothetical protein
VSQIESRRFCVSFPVLHSYLHLSSVFSCDVTCSLNSSETISFPLRCLFSMIEEILFTKTVELFHVP